MKIKNLFFVSSAIAASAIILIAYILLPNTVWTGTTIIALILLSLSVGFSIYLPYGLPNSNSNRDAAEIYSLGAMGCIAIIELALTLITFITALSGLEKISHTLMVIIISSFFISIIILNATGSIVNNVDGNCDINISKNSWYTKIVSLMPYVVDKNDKFELEKLAEKIRYSASGIDQIDIETDKKICIIISDINNAIENKEFSCIYNKINEISSIIDVREVNIKNFRKK